MILQIINSGIAAAITAAIIFWLWPEAFGMDYWEEFSVLFIILLFLKFFPDRKSKLENENAGDMNGGAAGDNVFTHGDYTASVELDTAINTLRGRVINVPGAVVFSGATVEELQRNFAAAVADYEAKGGEPPESTLADVETRESDEPSTDTGGDKAAIKTEPNISGDALAAAILTAVIFAITYIFSWILPVWVWVLIYLGALAFVYWGNLPTPNKSKDETTDP